MAQPFWITTSWDDGHILDLRIADYLNKYNLVGTFYIPRDYINPRLSDSDLVHLAARHEVGAHTLTHPVLTETDIETARHEIVGSREWLQDITGTSVTAFCYPKGYADQQTRDLVAEAGFEVARTALQYHITAGRDFLDLPTTVHIYPFPLRPVKDWRARTKPIRRALPYVPSLRIPILALRSWPTLALALLERVAKVGGIWHLWGHSWEIEKYGMWKDLDRILAAASQYSQAQSVTNSQLVHELRQPS